MRQDNEKFRRSVQNSSKPTEAGCREQPVYASAGSALPGTRAHACKGNSTGSGVSSPDPTGAVDRGFSVGPGQLGPAMAGDHYAALIIPKHAIPEMFLEAVPLLWAGHGRFGQRCRIGVDIRSGPPTCLA